MAGSEFRAGRHRGNDGYDVDMDIPESLYELLAALESQATAHRRLGVNSEALAAKAEQASTWYNDLFDLIEDRQGAVDLSGCDYYRGVGICSSGCREEPACQTGEPHGGWPSTRAVRPATEVIKEAWEAGKNTVAPFEYVATSLWEKGLLNRDYTS